MTNDKKQEEIALLKRKAKDLGFQLQRKVSEPTRFNRLQFKANALGAKLKKSPPKGYRIDCSPISFYNNFHYGNLNAVEEALKAIQIQGGIASQEMEKLEHQEYQRWKSQQP